MKNEKLGSILRHRGVIDESELESSLESARAASRRLGDELLRNNLITESDLFSALAEQYEVDFAAVESILDSIDRDLVDRAPRPYLEHTRMVPVRHDDGELVIAVADPNAPVEDLAQALKFNRTRTVLITPSGFRRIWSVLDVGRAEARDLRADDDTEVLGDAAFESRMVALFEAILLDAIGSRASDIHLEVYSGNVRLRYRVDGRLHDVRRFDIGRDDLRGLVNVVKIASEMDITERRLPQGGRLRRRAGNEVYDLRVQTQPSHYGEHLVIRLLHQDQRLLKVEDLGFSPTDADRYRRLVRSPQGMVLVVGPTGSGKSTTLYAALQELAKDATRKVITVEDPIEYAIDGIQQTQVHPEIGFAFANAMRAFVREDPDVILVGEIRDSETALEAIRASQTGHLVLSTLHCNDTVDAVQRLFDLGMHPNSIASELVAVISQRLVRRVCPRCREPVEPEPEILAELFPEHPPDNFTCFAGKGCGHCDGRGTRGRIAAIEFLRANEDVRRGIARQLTVDELRHLALEAGLKPIRNHLIELVLKGITPLSEVPRTLSIEQMAPPRSEG